MLVMGYSVRAVRGVPGSDLCFHCIVPPDIMGVSGFKKGKVTEEQPMKRLCRLSAIDLLDQSSGVELERMRDSGYVLRGRVNKAWG